MRLRDIGDDLNEEVKGIDERKMDGEEWDKRGDHNSDGKMKGRG